MQELKSLIAGAVNELYRHEVPVALTRPDAQFGDYTTNVAMQLYAEFAHSLKSHADEEIHMAANIHMPKNPREVAQTIVDYIQTKNANIIARAEVAGPGFINITMQSPALAAALRQAIESAPNGYGSTTLGAGKTVVCEFPSPNMAKPFSVGHIRSALQGWAMYQLMQRHGYKVITDNHVGDSGTPFGKWVVGFKRYSSEEQLNEGGINELSRVYITVTADMKVEKEAGTTGLADEVQSWLQKLEARDPEAVTFSERFNKISFDHMHHVMQRLGVSTEFELGESFFVARGQEMADELLAKGVAEESDGAIIVRLDDFGIDTPVMLRKANGTSLYATTDLATIEYREREWSPEKVFIHTGQEQAFYFRQLNALSEKASFKPVINHLWHGLVDQKTEDGKREKMSSRKGVVLLEDFLDHAEAEAAKHSKDGDEQDIKAVALGAVKFADFTADRKNGVLFDWENMFSVQGFSGPAVQYAAVRIKSILDKASIASVSGELHDFGDYGWADEKTLILQLLDYPVLLRDLHDSYELHKLAGYLYELARGFNRYYDEHRILDVSEPERSAKLWLISVVRQVLTDGLAILGIPTPNKM